MEFINYVSQELSVCANNYRRKVTEYCPISLDKEEEKTSLLGCLLAFSLHSCRSWISWHICDQDQKTRHEGGKKVLHWSGFSATTTKTGLPKLMCPVVNLLASLY